MQERIKQLRRYLGLSQEQFARKINKTPGLISLVETGRSGLSDESILEISSVFGVNAEWLRTGNGEMFITGKEKPEVDKEGIGKRINELRTQYGMSLEELAGEIGCSKNHIYKVVNGKVVPTEKIVNKAADVFDVSYSYLYTGEEEGGNKEREAEKIKQYMLKDSVAREVVLEAMKMDRGIWLKFDRVTHGASVITTGIPAQSTSSISSKDSRAASSESEST